MSVDKLVDSTQLDADLTSVANAIRTKGGTSASLAFPAGFLTAIAAIPSGGGGVKAKKGTYTGASDQTANAKITDVSTLGFTPDVFILSIHDVADTNNTQYAILFSVAYKVGTTPIKCTGRHSNTSGNTATTASRAELTSDANYYLNISNGDIRLHATAQYILLGGVQYDWVAYALPSS